MSDNVELGPMPGTWLDLLKSLPPWARFALVGVALNFPAALAFYLVLNLTGAIGSSPAQAQQALVTLQATLGEIRKEHANLAQSTQELLYYTRGVCLNTAKTDEGVRRCVWTGRIE